MAAIETATHNRTFSKQAVRLSSSSSSSGTSQDLPKFEGALRVTKITYAERKGSSRKAVQTVEVLRGLYFHFWRTASAVISVTDIQKLRDTQGRSCELCDSALFGLPWQLKHISLEMLRSAARSGCLTCKSVIKGAVEVMPDQLAFYLEFDSAILSSESAQRLLLSGLRNQDLRFRPEFYISQKLLQLEPNVPCSTDSASTLRQIQTWLSECLLHPGCGAGYSTRLPDRIINVGLHDPLKRVRLERSYGRTGRYITLSHCWGQLRPQCTTTKDTLARNESAIPWKSLPRTFQDVISLVRQLQVEFLWIDNICIIQDDHTHWDHQSAQMGSIYRNSFLTIAAIRASNGAMGLYSRLTPFHLYNPIHTDPGYSQSPIFVRKRFSHFSSWSNPDNLAEFPLLSRGWVYQERLLSRRILHFCAHEVVWECMERHACQCSGDEILNNSVVPAKQRRANLRLEQSPSCRTALWQQIVTDFGSLCLTNGDDALPALSGIAKDMQEAGQMSTYLAGLWSDKLLEHLCWHCDPKKRQARPRPQRAPTWSWASIEHGYTYAGTPSNLEPIAEVVDYGCVADGEDTTGRVRSGFIQLRAPLVKVEVEYYPHPHCEYWVKGGFGEFQLFLKANMDCNINPDDSLEMIYGDRSIRLLQLGFEQEQQFFLILRQHESGRHFERIGLVQNASSHDADKLFSGVENSLVTIR